MSEKNNINYPFTIRPLSREEGGGYFIEFSDLPGCVSDGETIEEAIKNGQEALLCWIAAAKLAKRKIPAVKKPETHSGKWVQRVPKSIHHQLVERARAEGVSLNTFVITLLMEGLGQHSRRTVHSHAN